MRRYCKAYHLRDMRQFGGWEEQGTGNDAGLSDDSIVYLWEDFTVVTSPIHPDAVLFANVTPSWQDFCTHTLQFAIPDNLRYAVAPQNAGTTA
jgi:hypothetical protein